MAYVIRAAEREWFKRCRRAWDLGARTRQNYAPRTPTWRVDLDAAVHEALAVYYFPGMWEWGRRIVEPLALEAFRKSMHAQRASWSTTPAALARLDAAWSASFDRGERLLQRYFEWARCVDRFTPIRVESDFEVNLPDPRRPGHGLVAPDGAPIRYRSRIELLVQGADGAYWTIDHRLVAERWEDIDMLLLDERAVADCWAWEQWFLGMTIAGTIYNELRAGDSPAAEPGTGWAPLGREIRQSLHGSFRRTEIPRRRAELDQQHRQMAREALAMVEPDIDLYPTPSAENCDGCPYRAPCIAMNEGADVLAILRTDYRQQQREETEPGRLGAATWSTNRGAAPPPFAKSKGD